MGLDSLISTFLCVATLLFVEPATGPIVRVLFGAWDPIPWHGAEPGRPGTPEGVLCV